MRAAHVVLLRCVPAWYVPVKSKVAGRLTNPVAMQPKAHQSPLVPVDRNFQSKHDKLFQSLVLCSPPFSCCTTGEISISGYLSAGAKWRHILSSVV
jgi:hypothetical protein